MTEALNRDGFRVVAVALREMTPLRDAYRSDDEREMTLVGLRRLPRPAEGVRRAGIAGTGRTRRRDQGADRRQRIRDAQRSAPTSSSRHGRRRRQRGRAHDRRRTRARRPARNAEPAAQGAHRAPPAARAARSSATSATASTTPRRCMPPTWASRSSPRWTSRRRRPTSCCWKKPRGPRAGRGRGPGDLRQHAEVHPHDGQLELRQRAVGAGGERLPALPADAAHPPAGAEPALRPVADGDPVRQRRRRRAAGATLRWEPRSC